MKRFFKAEEIFHDLPDEIKEKIFKIAEGKLVYFAKKQDKQKIDKREVLIRYAENKKNSYSKIGKEFGVSKMRICQIVKEERLKFSQEEIAYWEDQGLSLRQIAKLFKKSHETIRQIVE